MRTVLSFCLTFVLTVGSLFATVPPQSKQPIPDHIKEQLRKIRSEYNQGYWAEKFQAKFKQRALGKMTNTAAAVETVNVPILFGTYSNSTAKLTVQKFQELLFDGPNPTGTMTQFYTENSYGQLYMTGKCLGWFPTPRTFDYYVHDGGSRNAGLVYGGPDFTIDLLVEADKTVDFSKYVTYVDGEGAHVPQLGIVHTGGDAASGADNIWSHRWNVRWRLNQRKTNATDTVVNPSKVTSAGRYITNDTYNGLPVIFDGDYAIQPELSGNSNTGNNPKPIGVFAHEFGHIFGLPDLYDTDGGSEGLGNWCLMAGGSYGGNGANEAVPSHMSAWCKEQLGWTTPHVLTTYQPNYKFRYAEKYPDVVRINVRGQNGGQYFLIENRQKYGFDKDLLNSGLLIFHVDPSRSNNTNGDRYRVDLEQADALRNLNLGNNRGDAGDPYPGTANNRTFDGFSLPNSNDYAGLGSYAAVRKISNSDTVMYAELDAGTRPYVEILGVSLAEGTVSNSNGRVDPGETGKIKLKMQNIYPVNASNAQVRVSTTASGVTIDTAAAVFSLNGLGTVDSVFSVNVTASGSTDARIIPVKVKVTTADAEFQKDFETMLGYPATVLVDLDTVASENIGAVYRKIFENSGKHFELIGTRANTLHLMQMSQRGRIVLFSGRKKYNVIPDTLAQQLLNFVAGGGKVLMSGQNILEDMVQRNSPHRSQLLRASFTKNVAFGKVPIGIATDHLGAGIPKLSLAGGDAVPNQNSPDEMVVDSTSAHAMFRWNTTSGVNHAGLWWNNQTNGKVVFWSFGLEGANDSAVGVTYKSNAIKAVFNWFDGITSTPEIAARVPATMKLYGNYPNPFNPVTQIRFSVPADQRVTLTVHDILGRVVGTLVDGETAAGEYSVPFTAASLSSGIYFYTLRSGNFVETKKMMVLK